MAEEPPKAPLAGDFRLADWIVHPSLDRISRGDTVVHLRPQLTDLLVLLARHPGETLHKDRILQDVWATQFVGESALTRCITELRQALQDDARSPRLIETIPKRGYRLVGPVQFIAAAPATSTSGGDRAREEVPATRANEPAAAHGTTRVGSGVGVQVPPPSNAGGFGRRAPWTALKVAVVIGIAVTVGARDWNPPAIVSGRDTVLLGDVHNTTGNRVFDDALRLALAVNLEQAPFLRVLSRERMRGALTRMGRSPDERVVGSLALEVCRREGAAVLLAGSIAPLGSRYAVGIEATACGTGESVGRAIGEAVDKEHVLSVLEQVAARIRMKLGESRASLQQHNIPLADATTGSLEALEALTLGDESRDHARIGDALDFYRQATELDPGFALAWARRGAAAYTFELPEEAIAAFQRAYELRGKVSQPERFYIEAHYYSFVVGDPQKAIDAYRAWKRMYPGSLIPPTNLAVILAGFMGQCDAAIVEAREAVHIGPYSSIARGALAQAYLGAGRVAEARQALADAAKVGVSDRVTHYYTLILALFDGDAVALKQEIRWASTDPASALRTLSMRAAATMAGGRLREARALWAEAIDRAGEIGPARRVARTRLLWAEAEALVGETPRARTAVEAALAEDRSTATAVDAATVLAVIGDSSRAPAVLAEAASHPLGSVATLVSAPITRALVESNLGRDAAAMMLLQPVARFENGNEFGLAPLAVRGTVNLSAGRPAEAASAFNGLLRRRALFPDSAWVPYARVGLARALHAAGDTARSLAAYDDFLASWKDADRDAPLLRAAARERDALAARP